MKRRRRLKSRLKCIRRRPHLQFLYLALFMAILGWIASRPEVFVPAALAWGALFFTERRGRPERNAPRFLANALESERRCIYNDLYYMPVFMMREVLASRDIESYVVNEHIGSMMWYLARATGGVRLLVDADQYDEAIAVVREIEAENRDAIRRCPRCDSDRIEYRPFRLGLATFGAITGLLIPIPHRRNICFRCGKTWRPLSS
ncbi:MAG: DUF2007 domain-containing protein [bacterium]|nr:DUF2007 domain-containing protein [bacterium]